MKIKSIILISILYINGISSEIIEYKNSKLQKEIIKIFQTNSFTVNEIDSVNSGINAKQGKYFTIKNNNTLLGYYYVGRVNSCRSGGCSISSNHMDNRNSEYFDYFIIFDLEMKIRTVRVFNYMASYGHEITAKSWLKQFNGFTPEVDLNIGRNIDAISGATISVYAITHDIQHKAELLIDNINNVK